MLKYMFYVGFFLLIFAFRSQNILSTKTGDGSFLLNRPWFDGHIPVNDADEFSLYFFTDFSDGKGFVGACQFGTLASHMTELLYCSVAPAGIQIIWRKDGSVARTTYVVVKETNGAFDLKLTLESDPRHNNRKFVYYSNSSW